MPMAGPNKPGLPHQPRNPLAAVLLTMPLQFGMDAGRSIRLTRSGVHRAHSLQQRRVKDCMGRWWAVDPGIIARLGTPSTRAMVATGKQAWFALMNRKSPTAPRRSPVQTRPRLLTRYPAPAGAACSHDVNAPTRLAQRPPYPGQPPPVGPLAYRPQPPTRRSTAQRAQTPGRDPREIVQHEPGRPSGGGTQANTADASWASGAPLVKASGCPRKRVNPTARLWLLVKRLGILGCHNARHGITRVNTLAASVAGHAAPLWPRL